jgi:hypothetical protein
LGKAFVFTHGIKKNNIISVGCNEFPFAKINTPRTFADKLIAVRKQFFT